MIKRYVCGVTFQYELGMCNDIVFFESVEKLKNKKECWKECGIVELEMEDPDDHLSVKSHKWIVEQDLFENKNDETKS